MAKWKKLLKDILLVDGTIDVAETEFLQRSYLEDGAVDQEEADFLVDLHKSAKSTCKEFEAFVLEKK
jgi:hypothetical protein